MEYFLEYEFFSFYINIRLNLFHNIEPHKYIWFLFIQISAKYLNVLRKMDIVLVQKNVCRKIGSNLIVLFWRKMGSRRKRNIIFSGK